MSRKLYPALALLSSGIIAFQLALMQILSISQWSHFAYMVISVAMLGFGASGTALAILKKQLIKRIEYLLPALFIITGISIALIMLFGTRIFGGFDSYLIFLEKGHYYKLALSYTAIFVPFFTGALAIGLIYTHYVSKIGKLYFADLLGSGTGGAVALFLLWIFAPEKLPYAIALFPIVAGAILFKKRYLMFNLSLLTLSLLVLLAGFISGPEVPMSQYKSLSRAMLLPGAEIKEIRNTPYGQLKHLQAEALRYAPGLSLTYTSTVPVQEALYINGNWFGPLVNFDANSTGHFLNFATNELPFVISNPKTVLVPEAGTGLYASHALSHGAEKIYAVESNGAAIEKIKERSDIPLNRINFINKDSRSYIISSRSSYDLIILPVIESFGGSSGINAIKEQYLFTLESFGNMYQMLTPAGIIAVTVWMDTPARNTLKMLATLVQTAEDIAGVNPADHIMALRSWGTVTYILKKEAITREDIDKMLAFCRLRNFDPLLYPGIKEEEKARYNFLHDNSFFAHTGQIMSPQREELYNSYDYQIAPATDRKPFFSQFLKVGRLSRMREIFGSSSVPFLEVGYLIVLLTLAQISIAALLFIIAPLFFIGFRGKGRGFTIFHFSGIGIGFMFVEIVLIQKFTLFFGHPIYAATAVLSGLLIFSGVGARFYDRVIKTPAHFTYAVSCIIVLIVFFSFFLTPILLLTISAPLVVKGLISIILTAPLSFLMGIPFPYGLKKLSLINDNLIPWAWGINGSLSVVSTALATIIAVEAGFHIVMTVAAIAYFLVIPSNIKINR